MYPEFKRISDCWCWAAASLEMNCYLIIPQSSLTNWLPTSWWKTYLSLNKCDSLSSPSTVLTSSGKSHSSTKVCELFLHRRYSLILNNLELSKINSCSITSSNLGMTCLGESISINAVIKDFLRYLSWETKISNHNTTS